ncbi:hypothetical protein VLI03_005116, partial [Salmonella enterica]|nr:hypothetical protein [Salmonella enterica]
NDGHYFCGAGGNRPDGSDEALTVVQEVLDEDDPALDLEEEQRWMASAYG